MGQIRSGRNEARTVGYLPAQLSFILHIQHFVVYAMPIVREKEEDFGKDF